MERNFVFRFAISEKICFGENRFPGFNHIVSIKVRKALVMGPSSATVVVGVDVRDRVVEMDSEGWEELDEVGSEGWGLDFGPRVFQ